jgi:hypothetical protein
MPECEQNKRVVSCFLTGLDSNQEIKKSRNQGSSVVAAFIDNVK